MECATAESVFVNTDGKGSTVTAAPAWRRAHLRMAHFAAAGGNVYVATVSALYPEHLGTSVRSVQPVEAPVHLQGESALIPSLLSAKRGCNVEYFVSVTSVIGISLPQRYKISSPCAA